MNSVISGVTEESSASMYTDLSWCPSSGSRVIVADENYNINNNKFSTSNLQMDLSAVHRSPQDPELELHNATHSSSYNGSCSGYYTPTNNNNSEDYASGGGNDYYVQRYSPCYSVYDNSQENHDGNSVLVSRGGDEMCDNALDSHGNCIATGRPPVKRRNTANKKERRRTQSINNAFAELRDCIPNVPNDTKLSKIKTLRLARSYIAYLSDVLSGDDMCRTPAAFTAEISRKIGRGDEKRKKELLMAEIKSSSVIESGGGSVVVTTKADRKTKGRTGWPQHVWAQELQQ